MISLITPTHKPKHLLRLYNSLLTQTCKDFEWVIVPNNGISVEDLSFLPRENWIRIIPYDKSDRAIGGIKAFGFKQGKGEWLVEVDHDDELLPACVEKIIDTAAKNNCEFIYSDSMDVDSNGNSVIYGSEFGWRHYHYTHNNKQYVINIAPPASPLSVTRIWHAPNHVRAWKKDFYLGVGGHDINLKALDDLELMCRTYLYGKMVKITEPLYIYHVHGENSFSSPELNSFIQDFTWVLYETYITPLMEKWSRENKLINIDLCGGHNPPPGYVSVDIQNAEVIHDLNKAPWPFADNSVGIVRASDALEHLKDPITTMKEIHRILAPGGMLLSNTPSTDGRGAFQDPTHVSFWNCNSFWYYTRSQTAAYINQPVRFLGVRVKDWFPSEWHYKNKINYVYAHLAALKGGEEWMYAPGKVEI